MGNGVTRPDGWLARRGEFVKKDAAALAIVLLFGTLVRILVTLASPGILSPDSDSFYRSAKGMLDGDLFTHDPFKTPLYSVYLAAFMALGPTPTTGALAIGVQHLLGLLSTGLVYRMARTVFDQHVAFLSSLLFTGHTVLLFYERSVLSETLFVVLLALPS